MPSFLQSFSNENQLTEHSLSPDPLLELTHLIHATFWLLDVAITIFMDTKIFLQMQKEDPFSMGHPIRLSFCGMPFRNGMKSIVAFKVLSELVHSIQCHSPHTCTSLHPLLRSLGLRLIFSLAPSLPSTTTFWCKVVCTLNLCTYPFLWSVGLCSNATSLVRPYFFYFCVLFIVSLSPLSASSMRVWTCAV